LALPRNPVQFASSAPIDAAADQVCVAHARSDLAANFDSGRDNRLFVELRSPKPPAPRAANLEKQSQHQIVIFA
jgi:hypothetical protein